jgi:ATP-dependent DNA helicase DinG
MPTVAELLGDPSKGLVGEARDPQLRMAASIDEVLTTGGVYAVDAPTGTGKSLAYLAPALLAQGRRVVIATAKKSLQDQLELKDIPALARALDIVEKRRHALLIGPEGEDWYLARVMKGKSNYACRLLADRHTPPAIYGEWLAASRFGDQSDYPGTLPNWWYAATAENCIGRACKHYGSCGYVRLRQDVKQSRIVVVNHALLGFDMYYGLGSMVGGLYDILIVDEAHKLAEGIRSAYTLRVAENSIDDLVVDLEKNPTPIVRLKALQAAWSDLFEGLPNKHWKEPHRREPAVFRADTQGIIQGLVAADEELKSLLANYGVKGDTAESSFWEQFAVVTSNLPDDVRGHLVGIANARRKVDGLREGILTMQGIPCSDDIDANTRRLLNTVVAGQRDRKGKFQLSAAPIATAGIAHAYLGSIRSVVLTSATLAVDDEFDHVEEVVGVAFTRTEVLPSTFDYDKQGLAFVPRDLPHCSRDDAEYGLVMHRRIQYCIELARISAGGTFVLTTARDEMESIGDALAKALPWPVLVQGRHGTPQSVLKQYLDLPRAVLVGTKSFWEGVDVPGSALRTLILSKLPFPNPRDPLIQAREQRLKTLDPAATSTDVWRHISYVDMMIDLRQGIGRLIRTKHDRGVVAVLDSRIWTKRYGRRVRHALQFPVTGDFEDCRYEIPRIVAYFQRRDAASTQGAHASSNP